jgi:hypothetical protein
MEPGPIWEIRFSPRDLETDLKEIQCLAGSWTSFGGVGVTTSRSPHSVSSRSSSLMVDPEGDLLLLEGEAIGLVLVVTDSPELQDGECRGASL